MHEESSPPCSQKKTRDIQYQGSTSQPPPNTGYKGESAQIYPGSNLYPQRSSNKPFTLLVPIPLDSTSLRQTFVWPSSVTPSRVHSAPYNPSLGLVSDQGAGFGSEMDYQSYPTLYDSPGGLSRPGNALGFGNTALVNASSSNKARIEVKHYLTFRLSIDMLEFEGVPEEESVDLGTLGEYHILTNSKARQELPTFPVISTSSMPAYPFGISPPTSPNRASSASTRYNCAVPCTSNGLTSGSSSVSSGQLGHNNNLSAAASAGGISAIQPALTFLNSTAGLLDIDLGESEGLTAPPSFGASYDGSQRRGSKGSLGTVRSTNSGTSSAVGTILGLYSTQTTSSISDNSLGSMSGRRVTGESLMAGAIGAIKKKASGSLLTNVAGHLGPHAHSHSGPQRGSKVSVQRLKDFVIRVPITVVVEVDDHNRVAGAFGTASSSGDQNGTTESTMSTSADKSMTSASGQLRQMSSFLPSVVNKTMPPSLLNGIIADDFMPLRSTGPIGAPPLGSSGISGDHNPPASIGTNSIQSIGTSVGPDRAQGDPEDEFSTLHLQSDYVLAQQKPQFLEDIIDDTIENDTLLLAAECDYEEEDLDFQY